LNQSFETVVLREDPLDPAFAEPRDKIVLAAIACIERDGLDALTVRAIAKEAGVNVAAINYYFGTKENLVAEVLRQTLRTGFSLDQLDERLAEGMELRAAVEEFVVEYLNDAVRYPRIAQAHLHDPFVKGEYPKALLRGFGSFLDGFLERAEPILAGKTREERKHSVVQLWSAVLLVVMLPGFFRGFGMRFGGAAERESYVRDLLSRFLVPGQARGRSR
jgi:AcrR family transcriptional regulator